MNLLNNPGFESGSLEWTPIGPCTLTVVEDSSPEPLPDSTRCLLTTNRSSNWNGPSINMLTRGEPGRRYAISVWVRVEAPAAAADGGAAPPIEPVTFNLTQKRLCASIDGAGSYTPLGTLQIGGEWTQLTGEFVGHVCPDDDLQESVVYVEGAPPGVDFCLDDATFIPE